jgi:magnesium chelatase subunit I
MVADGQTIETGELVPAAEVLAQAGTVPGLAKVLDRLDLGDAPSPGEAAAAVEMVLEGLHLTRRLGKDLVEGNRTVYGA